VRCFKFQHSSTGTAVSHGSFDTPECHAVVATTNGVRLRLKLEPVFDSGQTIETKAHSAFQRRLGFDGRWFDVVKEVS